MWQQRAELSDLDLDADGLDLIDHIWIKPVGEDRGVLLGQGENYCAPACGEV
jgi:hypothetical protein